MLKSTYTKLDDIEEHVKIQEEIMEMMPFRSIEDLLLVREILGNSPNPYRAALELLEALIEMVGWWEKDGGSMDKCIEQSKAAIAKATGGEK